VQKADPALGRRFFYFLLVLLGVAIFLTEDFVFLIIYVFLGVYLVSRWWGLQGLRHVAAQRVFERRAFLGEQVKVRLQFDNSGWLPVAWLQVRESLPVGLGSGGPFQGVATLAPKGEADFSYSLDCIRRGYYTIGPLDLYSGDVLGAAPLQRASLAADHLTVFPKIIPLTNLRLPSHAPLGTLRHHQPVYEDPSRVLGKRDYVAGDSLRRVDWKATASSGRLQVKLFEPSIALETAIFLDLDARTFSLRGRYDVAELAIIVAASLANWLIAARQAAGLFTNGGDPLLGDQPPPPLPARRGRGHLLRILETLARVEVVDSTPLAELLRQHTALLPWGTTLVLITCQVDDALFDALFAARRSGQNPFLVQCGPSASFNEIRRKSQYFGFPIHQVLDERDLDIWRR
jgi:uncharacterized protein (DUF58 family)